MAASFPALPHCPPLARQATSSAEVGIGVAFGTTGFFMGGARVWVTPPLIAVLGCSAAVLVVLPQSPPFITAISGSAQATNSKSGIKIKRRISRPILCAIKPDPSVPRKPELHLTSNHLENICRTFYLFLCPPPRHHPPKSRWPIWACQCGACIRCNPWWANWG